MTFDAGSIESKLTLDRDPFQEGLRLARADAQKFAQEKFTATIDADISPAETALRRLQGLKDEITKNADFTIDANTTRATADIARLRAEIARLHESTLSPGAGDGSTTAELARIREELRRLQDQAEDTTTTVDKGLKKDQQSANLLLTAILLLGPALIPIGAFAASAGVAGVAGLGALAVAVKGVMDEIKAGTPVGQEYSAVLKGLKDRFTDIEHVAAAEALTPFRGIVQDLTDVMPELTSEMRQYIAQLGVGLRDGAHAGEQALIAFRPLIGDLLDDFNNLAKRADNFATGGGFNGFISFMRKNLPDIEHDLSQVALLVERFLQAGAGAGLGTLHLIGLIAETLNKIPIGVLQVAIPLVISFFTAFKIAGLISTASVSLTAFAATARVGSTQLGALASVLGKAGPYAAVAAVGIGVLGAVLHRNSDAAKDAAANQNAYLSSLKDSHGALTQSARDQVIDVLEKSKAFAAAKQLGIGLDQVTESALGNKDALASVASQVNATLSRYQAMNASDITPQMQKQYEAAVTLAKAISSSNGSLADAVKKYNDYAAANGQATLSTDLASASNQAFAKTLGATNGEYLNAAAAADKAKQAIKDNTLAMQLQNNAAGILSQALQQLGGNNLGVAQAQTAAATSTAAATAALQENGATLDLNTEKGRTNRGALESSASAAIALAQAVANQTGSTVQASAALADQKLQLENQLRAQKLLTPAVQAYVDTLFNIPPLVPTKIDLDAARAAVDAPLILATLNSIDGKVVSATVNANVANAIANISDVQQRLNALNANIRSAQYQAGNAYNTYPGQAHGGVPGMWTGGQPSALPGMTFAGAVMGPGGPQDDKAGLFRLSNDEHVLSAEDVARLGGQAGVYALRKSLYSGGLSDSARQAISGPSRLGSSSDGQALVVAAINALRSEISGHPARTAELTSEGVGSRLDKATGDGHRLAVQRSRQGGSS